MPFDIEPCSRPYLSNIIIGNIAGSHFFDKADLQVVRHCRQKEQSGLYFSRKRFINGYWETDRWFVWGEWKETRFVENK